MQFLYIRVIEAKEVVIRTRYYQNEPFVVVKHNGAKKKTSFRAGVEWWDKTFCLVCRKPESDLVSIQIREKGIHVFGSDWLGELNIKASDFIDGKVHQRWYKMEESSKTRARKPKGYIHLQIQLCPHRLTKPFTTSPVERVLSYDEWVEWREAYFAKHVRYPGNNDPYPLKGEKLKLRYFKNKSDKEKEKEIVFSKKQEVSSTTSSQMSSGSLKGDSLPSSPLSTSSGQGDLIDLTDCVPAAKSSSKYNPFATPVTAFGNPFFDDSQQYANPFLEPGETIPSAGFVSERVL